jgi:hypothetical protein
VEFKSVLTEEEIWSAFRTPILITDSNWIELFLNMNDGEQIELDVPINLTIRSFKVRVNKAARQANRILWWTESHYNPSVTSFIVEVKSK